MEKERSVKSPDTFDGGYVNAFLAAALTRVMRATVPMPALASASVLQSAAVGGSVHYQGRPHRQGRVSPPQPHRGLFVRTASLK